MPRAPLSLEQIQKTVIAVFADEHLISATSLTLETPLIEGDRDSLSKLEFMLEIEDEFQIEVPDSELEGLVTLNDVANCVLKVQG